LELADVSRRIGRHWRLIAVCVALGLVAAVFFHGRGADSYTATARLVLDTDPKSRAESISIADTGKAIATSPAQVRRALDLAGVTGRDPIEVAEELVSIEAVGTSAALRLSVSDRDPDVAAAVANALAERVIGTRLEVSSGQVEQLLADAERRIEALNERIGSADAALDDLNARVASATPEVASRLRAKRDAKTRQRDALAQQRGVLESERVALLSAAALRPQPAIISRATPPREADPSGWVPDLVLGAILGLVLGIGLAALLETVRPTLVGGDAQARAFETPFLGTAHGEPADAEEDAVTATRLWFAAAGRGIEQVALVAAADGIDVERLAQRLEAAVLDAAAVGGRGGAVNPSASLGEPGAAATPASSGERDSPEWSPSASRWPRLRARPLMLQSLPPTADKGSMGLVVVSHETARKAELTDVSYLLRAMPLPLLGLIAYHDDRPAQHAEHRERRRSRVRRLLRV
jgi:hypothetical protein